MSNVLEVFTGGLALFVFQGSTSTFECSLSSLGFLPPFPKAYCSGVDNVPVALPVPWACAQPHYNLIVRARLTLIWSTPKGKRMR